MHRNNVPAENPEEYYRRALAIPLVNRFIAEMTFRFNSFNETASKLLFLAPSIICDPEYNNLDIEGLIEQYSDDLPNPDVIDVELKLWKKKWNEVEREDRRASLAKAIKHYDKLKFPNVFTLIKIGCTLPITSAECERSFSTMRRLRTWLKSTMKSDRLSSLAIMNIHRNKKVDYKEEAKLFFTWYPMKIQEPSLIFGRNITFTYKISLFSFSISIDVWIQTVNTVRSYQQKIPFFPKVRTPPPPPFGFPRYAPL